MEANEERRVGRPSKLTAEVQKKIVEAILAGNYREVAAEYAGIAPETFSRWMSRPGRRYEQFRQAVEEAERRAEVSAVARIMAAAAADVQHAKWWLERKFPQRWGRKDRHIIEDPEGQAVIPVALLREAVERARGESGASR